MLALLMRGRAMASKCHETKHPADKGVASWSTTIDCNPFHSQVPEEPLLQVADLVAQCSSSCAGCSVNLFGGRTPDAPMNFPNLVPPTSKRKHASMGAEALAGRRNSSFTYPPEGPGVKECETAFYAGSEHGWPQGIHQQEIRHDSMDSVSAGRPWTAHPRPPVSGRP